MYIDLILKHKHFYNNAKGAFVMLKKISKKGFTIVETLIVLVVAGVIIGVVIVAAGGLNQSAKNSAIKKDSSAVLSSFVDYINNNNNTAPVAGAAFALPTGVSTNTKTATVKASGANTLPNNSTVYLIPDASCGASGATSQKSTATALTTTANSGHQAVIYPVINAGTFTASCISN